jgi:cytochrome c
LRQILNKSDSNERHSEIIGQVKAATFAGIPLALPREWRAFYRATSHCIAATATAISALADEFTKEDRERWQKAYMTMVQKGRQLSTGPELGTNGAACAQCHPNGANTHPETYPKFQQQLGRVIGLHEMINWCIQQPMEGKLLALDDPKMIVIELLP